ncbi:AAA family ATPase [Thiotrichales bacterium HSG1]|nr:AAA family ATPase [Thiotrichales bacterium HSG1]
MAIHSKNPFSSRLTKYYLTPELSQRVNLICHLIQNSEQLLLILAESGYGKTALLTQLKKIAEIQHEHWWTYSHTSTPAISPETFTSKILTAFNVRHDGKPINTLQDSLHNHIAATRYNGQLPVLFIDDAHKLPLATLKFIVELAMQGEALTRMRVILFCEPQISSILATPEFEIVHNTLVHSLDIPSFSKTQVRDYLQFYIKDSSYRNVHPFTSDVIKNIYKDSEGVPEKINHYAGRILHQFGEKHFVQPSLSYSKLSWGLSIVVLLMLIAGIIYWQYPTLFKTQPPPVVENFQNGKNLTEHAETTIESVKPIIVPTITVTDAQEDSLPITLEVMQSEEKWLKKQNPQNYTLQVLGAYDKVVLNKFLEQHELSDTSMYKTSFRGRDWYVLLSGNYASYSQATTALSQLPESLRATTKPWIRTFGSLKTK